jgi:hypothetical protein
MFAPWCPTCGSRILLGVRRVEAVERGHDGPRVVLRCFCGTALVWPAGSRPRGDRGTPVSATGVETTVFSSGAPEATASQPATSTP